MSEYGLTKKEREMYALFRRGARVGAMTPFVVSIGEICYGRAAFDSLRKKGLIESSGALTEKAERRWEKRLQR